MPIQTGQPWELPKGIAEELDELANADGITSLIVVEKLRNIAKRVQELSDDMRAGVMGDRERIAWADTLAHKYGEER